MGDFKVGDKVVAESSGHHLITKGEVYTVVDTKDDAFGGDLVYVTGSNGKKAGQYAWRFKLVEEPKFKVGDRVRVVNSRGAVVAVGALATIVGIDPRKKDWPLNVQWDEGPLRRNQMHGNYSAEMFEKVDTPARRFIVILERDGKLLPSTTPREYKTRERAEHVAKDMTKKHNGNFYVFESSFLSKPVKMVVETVGVEGVKL